MIAKIKKKRVKSDAATASLTRRKYTAPTPGLQDVHFTHGSNTAAAEFWVTQSRLARYIVRKDKGYLG